VLNYKKNPFVCAIAGKTVAVGKVVALPPVGHATFTA
jgi:hypothetical protein